MRWVVDETYPTLARRLFFAVAVCAQCADWRTLSDCVLLRHDNRIFNPFGDAKVSCADLSPPWTSHIYTFAEWAALGYDKGTTVGKTPPVDEIIGMAKAILRM